MWAHWQVGEQAYEGVAAEKDEMMGWGIRGTPPSWQGCGWVGG